MPLAPTEPAAAPPAIGAEANWVAQMVEGCLYPAVSWTDHYGLGLPTFPAV